MKLHRLSALTVAALSAPFASAELTNGNLLGPGVRTRPAYDGSASHHTELVPVVRYLGEPWFIRSTQGVFEGGLRMELAPGWRAGAQVAYEPGRRSSESGFLDSHAIADIGRGPSLGLQAEGDQRVGPVPLTLLVRYRKNTDADLGSQFDLRLSAGVFNGGPVSAGVFVQATWADAKSARTFYGLTPQQAAASGLPAYQAGAGSLYAGGGLLGSIDLSAHWVIVGSLEGRRLRGDAARSPLTERTTNHYLSVGLAYQ